MDEQCNIVTIEIWKLNPEHPDTDGKYRLAINIKNGGVVLFGPEFQTKREARQLLSLAKKASIFGYDEGFALAHSIVARIQKLREVRT
jgi:hypothetical protein